MRKKVSGDFNILTLFLGLLLGFFLGGSVVYWHFDRQEGRFPMEIINYMASLFKENPDNLSSSELTIGVKATNPNNQQKIASSSGSEKPGTNNLSESNGSEARADSTHETTDNSLAIGGDNAYLTDGQTNNALTGKTDEHSDTHSIYSIAHDRLLYTMRIVLPGKNIPRSKSEMVLDSLLGNPNLTPAEQVFFLEFWESPLNLLGYRKGKNKIAFYGIRLFDYASITSFQGKIFLKYLNNYYPLEITTSFKPLVPIIDHGLVDLDQ